MLEEISKSQIQKEKQKAKKLRGSQWWYQKLDAGLCHYCGKKFDRALLTMDHVIPLSRGGKSAKGNIVPSCKECNTNKKYYTPAELILRDKLDREVFF